MDTSKIKWGIVGCGNIANKLASDLALVTDAELYAVASRNIEKAKAFAQQHNSKKSYGGYDELFQDENIDIVYIATPHSSHCELSLKALENGKHVLCEKPLAINRKETEKMIALSKSKNLFFMEGLWTRFIPTFVEAKKRIDNGEIGEIKYIKADFSFKSEHLLESRVFNLNLGGGAILDIGIYPAFLAYALLGKPKEILAKSIFHNTTKCDVQSSMLFHYEDAQAILYSSFMSKSKMIACISGSEGEIYIHNQWHVAQGYTMVKNNEEIKFELPTTGIGFSHEIEECHNCIRNNQIESKLWSHQNSLDLISILDKVRGKVGLVYPQD
ncbi:Gfo/Idh/MocA family oxidoreductase [Aureibaculum sp. 2210JD6-5]|uniref:Gfo/Idh/MocA family protein n=1 Tax=Aureibaculum sp. 2210JD6-5 TaxID=3103957 RepID=UPI002AAD661D|nr:Gfo/Idh/MocA family oxidoreductase [Aureibaculum sp. 2210JD6-5]MDY7395765.1 Gfo/Idh/MocA family oxidoreductase [Aureibaculum sp. 2210JD6-5]